MSTKELHRRAKELLLAARELPEEEREAWLEEAYGDDDALREEVEALLAADAGMPSDYLVPDNEATLDQPILDDRVGSYVGRYKLLERLGEGGYGTVYLADQQEPVHRRVALKVIKLGMDTVEVMARFEAERQALALMEHPHIARIFDAGATDAGRPYFVMELVKGIPITQYCDENGLSLRQRLELFVAVCHAVQHAHQKGIVHRDLKPTNILVTIEDRRPTPKIIDFGIAKATQRPLTEHTLYTALGQFVGTPSYMSPEQAETSPLDVDTRSDIYCLGVLLFELLTGTTPLEARRLRRASLPEVQRSIREDQAPRPSSRVASLAEELPTVAKRRRLEPHRLRGMLLGDLDWIVGKALEKDRTRRYQTANALALDIGRHLNDEPVLAGPPSPSYRFRKFARRHRLLLAGASVLLVAALTATLALAWAFVSVRRERDRTQAALAQSESVTDFLTEMLGAASPYRQGRDVKVAEVLDQAAHVVGESLGSQPLVEARVRRTLGETYMSLGLYDAAEPQLQAAIDFWRREAGPGARETLEAEVALGSLRTRQGRYEEAEAVVGPAADELSALLGEEASPTLTARRWLGTIWWRTGRHEEAARLFRHLVETATRIAASDNETLIPLLEGLGASLFNARQYDAARDAFLDVLERLRRDRRDDGPAAVPALSGLAGVHSFQGRAREALPYARRAFEISHREFGAEHDNTLRTQANLALTLTELGDYSAAETLHQQVLEAKRRTLGVDHPSTLSSEEFFAWLYFKWERPQQALSLAEHVVQASRRVYGPEHVDTLERSGQLALYRESAGQVTTALTEMLLAVEGLTKVEGAAGVRRAPHAFHAVRLLERNGRHREAGERLEAELERLESAEERFPELVEALGVAAQVLTDPAVPRLNEPATAIRLARQANEIAGGQNTDHLEVLALALAQNGEAEEAAVVANLLFDLLPEGAEKRMLVARRLAAAGVENTPVAK